MELSIPITEQEARSLSVGDTVLLTGSIVTGRDAAHKWFVEHFVQRVARGAERPLHEEIRLALKEGALYHCGPVVEKIDGQWRFVAAGPTTSIREEPYEAAVIEHFGLRAIIGKGGMGPRTLDALGRFGAVYLHAVGGAATLIAERVRRVEGVWRLDFGVPEALWRIRVERLPTVVTMDSRGRSLHAQIEARSRGNLSRLLNVAAP